MTTIDMAKTAGQQLSPEEWALQFEGWADGLPALISDQALGRENLYPDR